MPKPDMLLGEGDILEADMNPLRPVGIAAAAMAATADRVECGCDSTHLRICFSKVLGTEKGMLQNLQV